MEFLGTILMFAIAGLMIFIFSAGVRHGDADAVTWIVWGFFIFMALAVAFGLF